MHTVFRFLRQLLLTVLLLALLVLVAAGGYFAVTGHKLYESAIQVTPIDTLYSSISSREGFVPYAQLPQTYINAVISAEDSRFTHHKGVDPVSIARALVTDLRTGSFAEGGSTITQQLIKNTVLTTWTQEKTLGERIKRKVQEQPLRSSTTRNRSLKCTSTPSISAAGTTASAKPRRATLAKRRCSSPTPKP